MLKYRLPEMWSADLLSANDKIRNDKIRLQAKIGSLIVHADEALSKDGHQYDIEAFRTLLADGEVQAWLKEMAAFLPVKRSGRAIGK